MTPKNIHTYIHEWNEITKQNIYIQFYSKLKNSEYNRYKFFWIILLILNFI